MGQVLRTVLLLMVAQALLGLLGLLSADNAPWLGLAATVAYGWLLWRVARVTHGQLDGLRRRGRPVFPRHTALWAAALWQIPAYATAPLWAPPRAAEVWQGAVLPLIRVLDSTFPGAGSVLGPGLWLAFLVEGAVFVWLVGRVAAPAFTPVARPAPVPTPGTDWAPARRFEEAFLATTRPPTRHPDP